MLNSHEPLSALDANPTNSLEQKYYDMSQDEPQQTSNKFKTAVTKFINPFYDILIWNNTNDPTSYHYSIISSPSQGQSTLKNTVWTIVK